MKHRKMASALLAICVLAVLPAGCRAADTGSSDEEVAGIETENQDENTVVVEPGEQIVKLEDGLSVVAFAGNDGFARFLAQGGASSDRDVIRFLADSLGDDVLGLLFGNNPFGCSTLAAAGENGEALFGRNFDWNACDALIVLSTPEDGYASISTVNRDFIDQSGVPVKRLSDSIQALIALYAPLDGMNEAGLAVSVNMIQDSDTIDQNTEKPDITTTTAIRLLLNQAADVKEALELLEQYDMHSSMGMMVHFAIADRGGRSVAVEYVDNEMVVTETPIVTNFYLAEGEKYGIGTSQSHTRYEILEKTLSGQDSFTMEDMRDALSSVSKKNFNEFESTEWSVVFDLTDGIARYHHRENYGTGYTVRIGGSGR
ncbi:MAG: linear amide C-N hydrolase [Clostridiales bacterium]|nr:linear amide C-N hydrolase [Clostridiales bacterium]